ncbi:hypothetical protein [Plantibacter sp. M259]|uniref:hypothetical protein n=1 Tax=Plantibacter sp. M259 TaxID=2583822 RepID=UPI001110A4F7|nr:hypothetical protein [Plantibacter sp. M259]
MSEIFLRGEHVRHLKHGWLGTVTRGNDDIRATTVSVQFGGWRASVVKPDSLVLEPKTLGASDD